MQEQEQLEEKDKEAEKEKEELERRKQREFEEEQRAHDEQQKDVLQQLAAEKVEKQRVALVQLQVHKFRLYERPALLQVWCMPAVSWHLLCDLHGWHR